MRSRARALCLLILFSGVALADDKECKTSEDCAMLGPDCCGGACRAIPKKQLKKAKKELTQKCAVASCDGSTNGPSETCSAPIVCIQYKCELGHVKAWDADKKKDTPRKDTAKE